MPPPPGKSLFRLCDKQRKLDFQFVTVTYPKQNSRYHYGICMTHKIHALRMIKGFFFQKLSDKVFDVHCECANAIIILHELNFPKRSRISDEGDRDEIHFLHVTIWVHHF